MGNNPDPAACEDVVSPPIPSNDVAVQTELELLRAEVAMWRSTQGDLAMVPLSYQKDVMDLIYQKNELISQLRKRVRDFEVGANWSTAEYKWNNGTTATSTYTITWAGK